VAFFKICELRKVARIFTDEYLDSALAKKLEDMGIQVVKVALGGFSSAAK